LTEGTASKGQAPASRFRVYQYLPYLRKAGIRYKVRISKPAKYFHVTARFTRIANRHILLGRLWYLGGKLWMVFNRLLDAFFGSLKYDACFIQRELIPIPDLFVEKFVLSCFNKVYFDFDDSIFLVPSWGKSPEGSLRNPEMEEKVNYLISRASQVIVSNEFLQEQVKNWNPRVAVIPTPVDTEYFRPSPQRSGAHFPLIIGWVGTSGNLFFLGQIMGIFENLWLNRKDFRLRIVCNIPEQDYGIDLKREYIEFLEWTLKDEIKNFDAIDIGIMPLGDDEWTRGKAGFKILQYMASGIPVVASPVGVNTKLVRSGENGLLANSGEEWQSALTSLLDNPELRSRLGDEGRRHVEENYSLEVIAPEWVGVLRGQL
jgi:glycosyltransferase involved in cell wall biosynthesis